MGPVVVVVVVVLFKTFTQYLKVVAAKEARVLERVKRLNFKGSNPEESFKREVRTYVR